MWTIANPRTAVSVGTLPDGHRTEEVGGELDPPHVALSHELTPVSVAEVADRRLPASRQGRLCQLMRGS
jgi:hypothetical protein